MHRFYALLLATLLVVGWTTPASASGDFGCTISWKLSHSGFTGCDNMAMLQPGNDTRANLVLLIGDAHAQKGHQPNGSADERIEALSDWGTFRDRLFPREQSEDTSSDYADGEGSRCRSNLQGSADFAEAVRHAKKLSEADRKTLIEARQQLQPDCAAQSSGGDAVREAVTRIQSPAGKAFASYLLGTLAFYDGDFAAAAAHFSSLRSTSDSWLKETASYMLGRVEVNRAQVDAFDEYGVMKGPEHVDQSAIDAGETALVSYLRQYPKGRYSASARGLLRRLYWLGGRTAKLVAAYSALFGIDPATRGLTDAELAEEIDNKLRPAVKMADVRDPIILAMFDLLNMRRCEEVVDYMGVCGETMTQTQLEAQKPWFASNPRLFDYLRAAYAYHVLRKPEAVLAILPDEKATGAWTNLDFSRAMLRGMALEATGRGNEIYWTGLFAAAKRPFRRETIELAIAMHHERSGQLTRVFSAGSQVRSSTLRERLLIYTAPAALLRSQARSTDASPHERDVALFTLLYKELTRGAYREFLADLALVPPDAPADGSFWDLTASEKVSAGIFARSTNLGGYDCPALEKTVATLAAATANARGRLCLAEWLRANGFDENSIEAAPPADELAGTASLFPGKPFSRLELYQSLIADPSTPGPDRAYALYRAVYCYAPSGHNSCGGEEVDVSVRKGWFNRLKKDYPSSRWAKELRYYW